MDQKTTENQFPLHLVTSINVRVKGTRDWRIERAMKGWTATTTATYLTTLGTTLYTPGIELQKLYPEIYEQCAGTWVATIVALEHWQRDHHTIHPTAEAALQAIIKFES